MFISDIIIKIFTKHFLTIIYSKKSHIFALGPGLHKKCFRSEYSKKNKKNLNKNKSTTNQLPKKTMQRIFTSYRNQCSLQEMDEKETAGIQWFRWKAFKRQQKNRESALSLQGKTNSDIAFCQFLSAFSCTAVSSQLQK